VIAHDAHCHFFSEGFFATLARDLADRPPDPGVALPARLGWDAPGSDAALADRWALELDRHDVGRAVLIASVPGDEDSVAAAIARHPSRFVGFFMLDPTREGAVARVTRALGELGLRGVCLFPAMHRYSLDDPRVERAIDVAAGRPGAVVFVHCGMLSVGVRKELGLPSPFDLRRGDPLAVAALAGRFPGLPFIVPHFGAGLFREALMAFDGAPNLHLDTSSSNAWMRYQPGLTLAEVFRRALDVAGAGRMLFGTDSSFFPRGWQRAIFEAQTAALDEIGADAAVRVAVLHGNFDRLFPVVPSGPA
jgi:hypothetical protein